MRVMTKRMAILFLIAGVLLTACDNDQTKSYTVGVINIVPDLDTIVAGFKEGMAELGYIEGENISYIYEGATVDLAVGPATKVAVRCLHTRGTRTLCVDAADRHTSVRPRQAAQLNSAVSAGLARGTDFAT